MTTAALLVVQRIPHERPDCGEEFIGRVIRSDSFRVAFVADLGGQLGNALRSRALGGVIDRNLRNRLTFRSIRRTATPRVLGDLDDEFEFLKHRLVLFVPPHFDLHLAEVLGQDVRAFLGKRHLGIVASAELLRALLIPGNLLLRS